MSVVWHRSLLSVYIIDHSGVGGSPVLYEHSVSCTATVLHTQSTHSTQVILAMGIAMSIFVGIEKGVVGELKVSHFYTLYS